ncbi:putative cellulose-binding GDSL lipase/acylhydrolase [Aspergillus tanneri]|uniref:Uncharacterized protein n=1 Tax=Aspergillus tanneri TaxID=1220188 RepID=A0A5M9MK93_9EURO|nr:uncharacterized protein ATNIH1004_006105 [Aspergillus tanneri]KAA8647412.1 hypothetical protein ATNIH1004_006105 [Aspergillus tanneri]
MGNPPLAIGGATIDNDLVSSSHGDLVSQVALFEKAYANKPDPAPWTAESAVFGFWIGINESMVAGFEMNHTDVSVVYYDSWAFMTKVLDRPLDYGFPDATCINQDGSSCFWWNDYHPSSKYHRLQAEDMKSVLMRPGW